MSLLKKRNCIFGCDALVSYNVPHHRFPNPDKYPSSFANWVSAIGEILKESDWKKIYCNKRVCDHHFDAKDKLSDRRLMRTAVPSVNLNCVQQSCITFVEADHDYSRRIRESFPTTPIVDITNLPGPSKSAGESPAEIPIPSASTATTCPVTTAIEKAEARKLQKKFDAELAQADNSRNGTEPPQSTKKLQLDGGADAIQYAEGITDYDDDVPQTSLQESRIVKKEPIFSWEKSVEVVPADDGDVVTCSEEQEPLEDIPTEVSLYCNDESTARTDSDKQHDEYQCNECREVIVGFRYTCVQCADWDLCGACEARTAHAAHYVLRVPSPRPYNEIQAVLAAIRQQILSENLFLSEEIGDSFKFEIKKEPEDLPPEPDDDLQPDHDPQPEHDSKSDPLSTTKSDSESIHTDSSSEESDANFDRPPRRKRVLANPSAKSDQSTALTISSNEIDGSTSPRRKRMLARPSTKHENVALTDTQPLDPLQEDHTTGLCLQNSTNAQSSSVLKPKVYRKVTRKLKAPQQTIGQGDSSSKFTAINPDTKSLVLDTPIETHYPRQPLITESSTVTLVHDVPARKVYRQPPRILSNIRRPLIREPPKTLPQNNPIESLTHDKPRTTFIRKIPLVPENPLEVRGSTETIIPDRTVYPPMVDVEVESDEPTASHLQDKSGQPTDETPEFCLRLPADTNEADLIQALQSSVTVRLDQNIKFI